MSRPIRNIAIIAHVDHGKTTLVDRLLQQSGTFAAHERPPDRVMDSNDLERERGITIFAKNCAIDYAGVHINIVDTPGHADFGGEVERVLGMVDGALLLVDAVEGPMPQTRFVTRKALALGLKPIVVVNKVDRPGARPDWVVNRTFELFDKLGASEAQLDFPVVYASALQGWAATDLSGVSVSSNPALRRLDMRALFETILEKVPAPKDDDVEGTLQLQLHALDYSSYVGRIGVGKMRRGRLRPGQEVAVVLGERELGKAKVNQVLGFKGLERAPQAEALAGDIVLVTGIDELAIGATIADVDRPEGLPPLKVDEPTLTMQFVVNTSPFAGTEGKYVTSRNLRERLQRELLTNMALRVEETGDTDVFVVHGRGELHLTILVENMRREGYELAVGRPRVITRTIDGATCEPYELLTVDLEDAHQGAVMEALGTRRGDLVDMQPDARADRFPERVHESHARHRDHDARLRRVRPGQGRDSGAAQRRPRVAGDRRGGRVRALQPAGARTIVRVTGGESLRGHGRRHPQPRQRPHGQPAQGEEAHQHSRRGQGRERAAHAAGRAHARVRGRVHRRRRTGGGDAAIDPGPEALSQGARAQTRGEGRERRGLSFRDSAARARPAARGSRREILLRQRL